MKKVLLTTATLFALSEEYEKANVEGASCIEDH